MPIRCFWVLSQNINRIQAQNDMRSLAISMYCQDKDACLKYRESLEIEMGKVFEFIVDTRHERVDHKAVAKLKASLDKKKKK